MRFRPGLFLLILLLPFVDLYLLIKIGNVLGAWLTITLLVFSSIFGFLLLKHQQQNTLVGVRRAVVQNQIPALAMIEGAIVMVSAVLFLIPGFLSDTLGILILLPIIRRQLALRVFNSFRIINPGAQQNTGTSSANSQSHHVLDGEYKREDK